MRSPRLLLVALLVLVTSTVVLLGQEVSATAAGDTVSAQRGTTTTARAERRRHKVQRMLRIAKRQKGDHYQYGATGPNRFDCSGLVFFSTHRAGFRHVPRTSSAQSHFMRHIRRARMHPGDFMFFHSGGGVYHVGIFVGRHRGRPLVLHAPGSGQRVRVDRVWTNGWFPGTLRR